MKICGICGANQTLDSSVQLSKLKLVRKHFSLDDLCLNCEPKILKKYNQEVKPKTKLK